MKNVRSLIAAAVLAIPLAVPAAAAEHKGHAAAPAHAAAGVALADGLVKKVDKAGGKLTVAHGPLPNGMPAMTMSFRVKEAGWLETVKEGQAIRFAVGEGGMTIVRLEAAK